MINPYIGEVTVFAFSFAPSQVGSRAEGQLLPIAEYTELFSVIRTTFGGDGVSTFGWCRSYQQRLTDELARYHTDISLYLGHCADVKRNALPGELALLPYNPPPSWINCDGQILQISQYESLFKILGTTFGGNGTTTFGIPDLKAVPPLLPKGQGSAPPRPPSIYSIANVPSGSTAEGILAEVKLFPSACPLPNWSTCDGQLLPMGSNTGLFSLLQNNLRRRWTDKFCFA